MAEPACTIALPSGLSATILAHGATLASLRVPGPDGHPGEVLIGPPPPADHRGERLFRGSSIGRYANRIGGAGFMLDGRQVRLDANEGANTLHGGAEGFDRRDWQVLDRGPRSVVLGLDSPDGDQGFPGALQARADFALDDPGSLTVTYRATVTAPCPVSLTSHGFFNLAGGGPVRDHRLRVAAKRYLPVDAALIPKGPARPVAGTRFDFRDFRPLPGPDEPGLDHCLCLDHGPGLRPVAWLEDRASGRAMRLSTDQPGLQVFLARLPAAEALCLEPQAWPDAPNRNDFPDAILRPGQIYTNTIRLDFTARLS